MQVNKNRKEILFKITSVFIIVFLCLVASSYADVIYLKNGNMIEGEILGDADEYLEVRVRMGEAKINKNDVESIEKKELPEGFFDEEEVPVEEIEGEVEEPEIKEKEEQEKEVLVYEISIEAEFLTEDEEGIINIQGETNFPDGALIYVFLKRLNKYIALREIPVKDGLFSLRFGPFEKELPFGEYIVIAAFMPDRQPEDVIEALEKQVDKLVKSSCLFKVGSPEQIDMVIENIIPEIKSDITELETLYQELEDQYKVNLVDFNSDAWDEWSLGWRSRVEDLRIRNRLRMEKYIVPLFPEAEQTVRGIVNSLSYLWDAYSMKFKEPEKYTMEFNSSDTRIRPRDVKEFITGGLIRVKKVLGIRD